MSWSADAATAGRETAVPSSRASWATAATWGSARVWPIAAPASRCSASSSGSAAINRPALSTRPRTARGSEGALAMSPSQGRKRGAIGRRSRQPRPRLANLLVGHGIENADRVRGIVDSEQVADAREQPGAQAPARPGAPEQAHHPAGLARKQLLDRRIGRNPGAARENVRQERRLAFMRRGENQIIAEPAVFV